MRIAVAIVLTLLLAVPAWAGCATVTVTNVSTQIFAADDLKPATMRIFSIQNNDPTGQDCWCTKTAAATVKGGNYIKAGGGEWSETVPLPTEAINCITQSSTTTVYACDYGR